MCGRTSARRSSDLTLAIAAINAWDRLSIAAPLEPLRAREAGGYAGRLSGLRLGSACSWTGSRSCRPKIQAAMAPPASGPTR